MRFRFIGLTLAASSLALAGCSPVGPAPDDNLGTGGRNTGGRGPTGGAVGWTGGAGAAGGSSGGSGGAGGDTDASAEPSETGAVDPDAGPPAVYPQPGQQTGPGILPAKTAGAPKYLGTLWVDNRNVIRDLGFTGVVNGQIVWTFGDTLLERSSGNTTFCAGDSTALGDRTTRIRVRDKALAPNGCPLEWIPLTAAELANGGLGRFAEGGTNVVEYAPNKGLVWFLKNDRFGGTDNIVGAGVATVTADANGAVATRLHENLWTSSEPYWGDTGVAYDALDQNVYVFGHGPTSLGLTANVYLAKAPATQATDVTAYQYWDQSKGAWTAQRFGDGQNGTAALTDAQAIFTYASHGQSNPFWSNHYNTWMFVHGADVPTTGIYVSTAPKLEGPWTAPVIIGTTCPVSACGGTRYAIAPHPEFDPSGKTVMVTWTDWHYIHAVEVAWQ
jgi:hypothetical protein